MNFIERIFGKRNRQTKQPSIRFGRFTDSYKLPRQYDAWDESLQKFEEDSFLESYQAFFEYLKDDTEENVWIERNEKDLNFYILQGSKKIVGYANAEKVRVEAKVARADGFNVGFMRRLVEKNFTLNYSRFAIDKEEDIAIVFDTSVLDGSPYKLYYAIKELAINADKQDDLLIDEFDNLFPVDLTLMTDIPQKEKKVKYQYIKHHITKVLGQIENSPLSPLQYPGAMTYLLLDLTYKLDFLTRPEGYLMETLERIHRIYFTQNDKNDIVKKNTLLIKEFNQLLERSQADYFKEMYKVTSTFGITTPVMHDRVVSFIEGEIGNMDWYSEKGYQNIAMAVPGYIVGYCLFNYAVPKPVKDLFLLYYQIVESDYFKKLGFDLDYYHLEKEALNKKEIKKEIRGIIKNNEDYYPGLSPNTNLLNFTTLPVFAQSYLLMIKDMSVVKVEV